MIQKDKKRVNQTAGKQCTACGKRVAKVQFSALFATPVFVKKRTTKYSQMQAAKGKAPPLSILQTNNCSFHPWQSTCMGKAVRPCGAAG
jgi:hypothetical protein